MNAHPTAGCIHRALTVIGAQWSVSRYIRPSRPGACIFFTVTLAERGSYLLIREIARLREAVRITRAERPFSIDAWVVLPDHVHCVWTLPKGDAEFSTRWSVIKARFALSVPEGARRRATSPGASVVCGNGGFGNITFGTKKITRHTSGIVG